MSKSKIDELLLERLNNLSKQTEIYRDANDAYLLKEAQRKSIEARLVKTAEGKSQAEKLVNAQSTEEWLTFHLELAKLEGERDFQRLRYELLDKAYLAEYTTFKITAETISRHGAA